MSKPQKPFEKLVSYLKSTKTVLEWIGLWTPLVAAASAIGWASWAAVEGLPTPIIVACGLTLAVAISQLMLTPGLIRLLMRGAVNSRPNYEIWRHSKLLHVWQAAHLLADIEWGGEGDMHPTAKIWAHALGVAIDQGEIRNESDLFNQGYPLVSANWNTKVTVEDLRRWAEERGITAPFLAYLDAIEAAAPAAIPTERRSRRSPESQSHK